jgi:hypothetical protein
MRAFNADADEIGQTLRRPQATQWLRAKEQWPVAKPKCVHR